MYRKSVSAAVILTVMCMLSACSDNSNTKDTPDTPSQTQGQTKTETQSETPKQQLENQAPAPSQGLESDESEDTELSLLKHNFSNVVGLSMDRFQTTAMIADGTDDIILSVIKFEPESYRIVRVNLTSGQSTVLWESSDEGIFAYTLKRSDAGSIEWETYGLTNTTTTKYLLTGGKVQSAAGSRSTSPDGRWSVNYGVDTDNKGIWGKEIMTGEKKRWTKRAGDTLPLWLPDSSGFVYLHDTGVNLGDGAGQSYKLARFDIASQKTSVLPFEEGFWGRIEWLEPGVSLVAHNGFDDAIGLKMVNLKTGKEQQVVDTGDWSHFSSLIDPVSKRLVISDQGAFEFYGSDGTRTSRVPWPTDLDSYTKRHAAGTAGSEEIVPYYEGEQPGSSFGPSSLQASPDGMRLAYLLGAIGESVEDVVQGTRIAVSDANGGSTKLLTQDYLRISHLQWTPDGSRLIALFTKPEDRKQAFIGIIDLEKSAS